MYYFFPEFYHLPQKFHFFAVQLLVWIFHLKANIKIFFILHASKSCIIYVYILYDFEAVHDKNAIITLNLCTSGFSYIMHFQIFIYYLSYLYIVYIHILRNKINTYLELKNLYEKIGFFTIKKTQKPFYMQWF